MIYGMQLCSVNQRYNLKAIHNMMCWGDDREFVVLSKSKIQSKSNSQHVLVMEKHFVCCAQ